MYKPLTDLEIQVLEELAKTPTEFVSSTAVSVALRKRTLTDGIAHALGRMDERGLVEPHPFCIWKFRITPGGLEELAEVAL